jgi:hypothetical protein
VAYLPILPIDFIPTLGYTVGRKATVGRDRGDREMDARKYNQLPTGTIVKLQRDDETAEGITQLVKAVGKYGKPYTYSKVKVTKVTDEYGIESTWNKSIGRYENIHHDFISI